MVTSFEVQNKRISVHEGLLVLGNKLQMVTVKHFQGCHSTGKTKSIFPDRENTGNLPKIFKILHRNLTSTQGEFGNKKKKLVI